MQLDLKWIIVPRYCTRYLAIHGLEVGGTMEIELLSRGLCNIGLLTSRVCHADCSCREKKLTPTYFSIHICTEYRVHIVSFTVLLLRTS